MLKKQLTGRHTTFIFKGMKCKISASSVCKRNQRYSQTERKKSTMQLNYAIL